MPAPEGQPGPARAPALAWLADWLETGPVPAECLRRVLVVGDDGAADLLAARLPASSVVTGSPPAAGGEFDLVVVIGTATGADRAGVPAAVAAVRGGGALLVLTCGAPAVDGPLPTARAAQAAGLRLVGFDDLTDGSSSASGPPRRWLRATYRRVSR